MNKHVITNFLLATMLTASSVALAGQPSPNAAERGANSEQRKDNAKQRSPRAEERARNSEKTSRNNNPKVEIAHCGCNYDGSGLEWKHIRVSTNAKGHLRHTAESEAGCINDIDEEVFFTRGYDDCRTSDEPSNNIGGLEPCEPLPVVGTSCQIEEAPVEPEV